MEMTISTIDIKAGDFSNRASEHGGFPTMQILTPVFLGLLSGPGFASVQRILFDEPIPNQAETRSFAAFSPVSDSNSIPAGELLKATKEGWSFNMTELAELLGVQRPTLYNWLNGKTSPDAKFQKHLQTLAAASVAWKQSTGGANWDFLQDYSGPKADEVTIRETLRQANTTPGVIRELIALRMKQYQEAFVRAREILGEPLSIKGDPLRESTRKLNKRWAKQAQKLHRARNANL